MEHRIGVTPLRRHSGYPELDPFAKGDPKIQPRREHHLSDNPAHDCPQAGHHFAIGTVVALTATQDTAASTHVPVYVLYKHRELAVILTLIRLEPGVLQRTRESNLSANPKRDMRTGSWAAYD